MTDNFTKRVRKTLLVLFVVAVLAALGGWLVGRDPTQLHALLTTLLLALGVGEASNIGKRATTKSLPVEGGNGAV